MLDALQPPAPAASVIHGDCLAEMRALAAAGVTVQAIVTDPPYHLTNNVGTRSPYPGQYTPIGKPAAPRGGFMGKQWDGGNIASNHETWRLAFDLLPPGGHLLAFGGTRTYHRMVCAIEDAGFEIRDAILWIYGTGFPKSHDVSKGIDKTLGAEREIVGTGKSGASRSVLNAALYPDSFGGDFAITAPATAAAAQWAGWGTALKPSTEIIVVARKPLGGLTVAQCVMAHGTGAINVDACRVGTDRRINPPAGNKPGGNSYMMSVVGMPADAAPREATGRWPANLAHDGSPEVEAAFAAFGERGGGSATKLHPRREGSGWDRPCNLTYDGVKTAYTDGGGTASRFFYSAKASRADRAGSSHPTVKPQGLMRWLCRMVCPPGGTILDPFAGSGSTLQAALAEGFSAIGIEREAEYHADILRRLAMAEAAQSEPDPQHAMAL